MASLIFLSFPSAPQFHRRSEHIFMALVSEEKRAVALGERARPLTHCPNRQVQRGL